MGLKNIIRKWLGVPDVAPVPASVTAPAASAPVPKTGFLTSPNAPTIGPVPSWNDQIKRYSGEILQKLAPAQYARVDYGADGAMTVAMDDTQGNAKFAFSLSGYGSIPDVQLAYFAAQAFIGYQLCATFMQHWFIDKACSMPARDAIRNGYEITRSDDEELDPAILQEFRKLDKRFKVKWNCSEAVRWCRCFGIRIVLFEVNSADPDYYLKPFNPDGVTPGSYKGMSQIDPYWITPELDFRAASDPASQHFYEPTYWRVNGQRYHRSHLVIIKTCEVADVLKPTYFYGGIPLPQRVYERVYAAERTSNEAPQLAMTKRMTAMEGVDMAAALANPKLFNERVMAFCALRDNYGIYMTGGEEKIVQLDTALADMDALIMTQWQLACAIVEVPGTKMMGTQPKGFNATGEYEASNYRETLESVQEHDMTPIIERHHMLCMRAYIAPKFGVAPFETAIGWNEVDPETSKEKAEREKMDADRDKALADTGALDGIDIRNRLIKDKDSSYAGIAQAIPEGPRPVQVIDPDAPRTAPNTPPGSTPTNAPDVPAPAAAPSAPNVGGRGPAPAASAP